MTRVLRSATAKRLIKRSALRKGLLGGSPLWRTVYGLLTLRKIWSRVSKKGNAPVEFREHIPEGEAWTLVHVPEASKRGRGEGRRFLIGPKRKPPRAPRWIPPALVVAARRILESPDPARINAILGADVVHDRPPTRRERRELRRIERETRRRAPRPEVLEARDSPAEEAILDS